jgi:hypothetical protein
MCSPPVPRYTCRALGTGVNCTSMVPLYLRLRQRGDQILEELWVCGRKKFRTLRAKAALDCLECPTVGMSDPCRASSACVSSRVGCNSHWRFVACARRTLRRDGGGRWWTRGPGPAIRRSPAGLVNTGVKLWTHTNVCEKQSGH